MKVFTILPPFLFVAFFLWAMGEYVAQERDGPAPAPTAAQSAEIK